MPVLEETKAFLRSHLEGKSESMKRQAKIALTHWENFTRQKPSDIKIKDVDEFIFKYLKRLKSTSLSVYLFHIGKYLAWSEKPELEKHVMNERNKLDAGEIDKSFIDHNDVFKMLTKVTELRDKLIIRLLVFSEIPTGCLKNLKVRHIFNQKNYGVPCNGKMISGEFHLDTSEIIRRFVKERKLKKDDELIGIGERAIQYLIPEYAKKVGIKKKVTPKDLRKVGKDPFKRKVLMEMYEEARMKNLRSKNPSVTCM